MHQDPAQLVEHEPVGVPGGRIAVEGLRWSNQAEAVAPPLAPLGVKDQVQVGREATLGEVTGVRWLDEGGHSPQIVVDDHQAQTRGPQQPGVNRGRLSSVRPDSARLTVLALTRQAAASSR